MSRGTCTVVKAEKISASMFSRWGSLLWHVIDILVSRLRPLNLWQEAWEALARDFSSSGSLGTWRGGHIGSSAGRPATSTSSRFRIEK